MPELATRSVLNVDDHDSVRYLRTKILRMAGFEVKEAATGRDALRLVTTDLPRLVVLDVGLPDIHGFEVCRQIKSDPLTASIPILQVSASSPDTATAAQGLEGGADAYLAEPIEPEILVATVKALLRTREAEEALRAAAWQWQATFDAIQDGVALLDLQGIIIRCNAALGRILGRKPSDIIGRPCLELMPAPPGTVWEAPLGSAVETARHRSGVVPLGPRFFRVSADPVVDLAGGLSGAVWILSDVTERRLAEQELASRARQQQQVEEALRRSEERLQTILANAPAVVLLKDLEGTYLYVNRPFAGFSEAELVGKTAYDLFPKPLADLFAMHDRQALAERQPLEFEEEVSVGGVGRTFLVTRLPILDPTGEPRALCGILTDITDRRTTEHERAQLLARERSARADAEAANRAKDEFLATVSHELRTPLTAILGWSRMLRNRKLSAEETREAIEVIERNAKAQARLIEDLMDSSRIIAGKLRLNLDLIELADIIEASLELLRPTAEAKRLALEWVREAPACTVRADPERLQQVVINLVSNSVKFTPEGGRVEIRMSAEGDRARLTVRDEGIGIPEDLLPYIFEPFRQGGEYSSRQAGVGLGLAIVRRLVELHGGFVHAESPGSGLGATFTVELPLSTPEGSTATAASQVEGDVSLSGVRVLVVEDQQDNRRIVIIALEQAGGEIRSAESALEALVILQQWIPNVLVSDIGMPLEDGLSLIRNVRRMPQCKDIPALAVSAHARDEDRRRALDAGFTSYLSKPVDLGELLAEVARLARRA